MSGRFKYKTAMYVWSVTSMKSLLYGCETLFITEAKRHKLDVLQGKLLKCIVGIGPHYRTSPLLKALKICKSSVHVDFNSLILLKNIFNNDSAARKFYIDMLHHNNKCKNILSTRVGNICHKYDVDMMKLLLDTSYMTSVKNNFFSYPEHGQDGLTDSIRSLLYTRGPDEIFMLKNLLKAF